MTLIACCSASGAPGVTTSCLALTWVWAQAVPGRRALLVDADSAGSGVLPGFLEAGIPAGGGVLGLAAERTATADAALRHAVSLDDAETRLVLTGVTEPAQSRPLASLWPALVEVARDVDAAGLDVLVDVGRLGHRWEPTPLVTAADVAVVLTRGSLAAVSAARAAVRSLAESRGPGAVTTVLPVGRPDPYSPAEVAAALAVDALPALPQDPWAAREVALGGAAGWRLARRPLLRGAGEVAADLAARRRALAPVTGRAT